MTVDLDVGNHPFPTASEPGSGMGMVDKYGRSIFLRHLKQQHGFRRLAQLVQLRQGLDQMTERVNQRNGKEFIQNVTGPPVFQTLETGGVCGTEADRIGMAYIWMDFPNK